MNRSGGVLGRLLLIAVVAAVLLVLIFVAKDYRTSSALPSQESISTTPFRTITKYAKAIGEAREALAPVAARFPGLSVSVGVGHDVVWSEGVGYMDLAGRSPVTSGTLFRIYSLSKPMTAAAAAALSVQGILDLDASVRDYLPSLPEQYAPVTARRLIGHLGGVRHYKGGEWGRVSNTTCASPSDALELFINDPLLFPPGEKYEYSSYGYVLLSAVLESAAGMDFEKCVVEKVARPSWMRNTMIEVPGADDGAFFYEPAWFGRAKVAAAVSNICRWGAGAFLSTPDDMTQFGLALIDGRIVGGEALDDVFTSMKTSSGEETGYAFGWGVGVDEAGRRYAGHSGGAAGGRSAMYLIIDRKVVVTLLANMEGERLTGEAKTIAEIFARFAD